MEESKLLTAAFLHRIEMLAGGHFTSLSPVFYNGSSMYDVHKEIKIFDPFPPYPHAFT